MGRVGCEKPDLDIVIKHGLDWRVKVPGVGEDRGYAHQAVVLHPLQDLGGIHRSVAHLQTQAQTAWLAPGIQDGQNLAGGEMREELKKPLQGLTGGYEWRVGLKQSLQGLTGGTKVKSLNSHSRV